MRLEVIPLDFMGSGALLEAKDKELFNMALDYISREMAEPFEPAHLQKCWVVAEMWEGKPVQIHGISGYVMRPDIPVFRVSGDNAKRATKMLVERMNGYFSDQGCRGFEVFIRISSKESPEQRCEAWQESLEAVGAVPADRFSVKVR